MFQKKNYVTCVFYSYYSKALLFVVIRWTLINCSVNFFSFLKYNVINITMYSSFMLFQTENAKIPKDCGHYNFLFLFSL